MVGALEGRVPVVRRRLEAAAPRARDRHVHGLVVDRDGVCAADRRHGSSRCDVNEETSAVARRYAEEAGVADRIEYRLGPAVETLATLEGPFDLVFIDADKPGYIDYYEAVLPKLADDGVILADNTLASGNVIAPNGAMSEAIARFNDHVRADDRVECVLLTVRDGITLDPEAMSSTVSSSSERITTSACASASASGG